jgi:uncharacterized membrane protein
LIGITSTMVTVIALLLGLAVVALQLSSTQFSPRLLRNFLRDRPNQLVLGVFVGTFAYSAAGLFTVGVSAGQRSDSFPRFAVTVAVALLFLSLALLVFFADHLAHSLQVDHIMRVVERTTLPVIHTLPGAGTPPAVPPSARAIPARTSGYLQVVYLDQLVTEAAARHAHLRLRPRVGEHVVAGATLAWAWPTSSATAAPDTDTFAAILAKTVRLDQHGRGPVDPVQVVEPRGRPRRTRRRTAIRKRIQRLVATPHRRMLGSPRIADKSTPSMSWE